MDEREALRLIDGLVDAAGDDAAVLGDATLAVDMLHETADFPPGVTPYTIGWRAIAVTLSDQAAMGAVPEGTLAVYGAPAFDPAALEAFVNGATAASEAVGAAYVGGDLDIVEELTVVGVSLGRTEAPVYRSGARRGDVLVVTGTLGRGGLAYRLFEAGAAERANELFCFEPRVEAGRVLAESATAMIDSSDGLARSLHLLAESSGCGFEVDGDAVPVDARLSEVTDDPPDRRELALSWGEDFELVATVPDGRLEDIAARSPTPIAPIGRVTAGRITIDGAPLPDRGFTHGAR